MFGPAVEQVQCLVYVNEDNEPTINRLTLKKLEERYLFARPSLEDPRKKSTDSMKTSTETGKTSTETGKKSTGSKKKDKNSRKTTTGTERQYIPAESGNESNEAAASTAQAEATVRRLELDNYTEREDRIAEERLTRRIIILSGDFDTMARDLSSRGAASQESIKELTIADKGAGIYCLTPSIRQKPIYMIVCLDPRISKVHAKLLRLALQMSRYLVVYYGEMSLLADNCFRNLDPHQGVRETKKSACRSNLKRLWLDDRQVDILHVLRQVLLDYPLVNGMDATRSVQLHCLLDISHEAGKQKYKTQCDKNIELLFGISLHQPTGSVRPHSTPLPPVIELRSIAPVIDFNITDARNFWKKSTDGSDENGYMRLDPSTDPMWLYSMCGLLHRPLLHCVPNDSSGTTEGPKVSILPVGGTPEDARNSLEDTPGKKKSDDVQAKFDRLDFGLFEVILESWKKPVQITTLFAGSWDKDVEELLQRFVGLPFASAIPVTDFKSDIESKDHPHPVLLTAWRYSQATNMLNLVMVFNCNVLDESVQPDEDGCLSRLVFAATAISQVCVLVGGENTEKYLQRYVNLLECVAGDQLSSYEQKNCEKEIFSGTLLVGSSRREYKDDRHVDVLLERFFANVVPLDSQALGENTILLLKSYHQLNRYSTGSWCLQCLKMVLVAVNDNNLKALTVAELHKMKHRALLKALNDVARGKNQADESTGCTEGVVAFSVEISVDYFASASGVKVLQVPADSKTHVRTDLTVKQRDCLQQLLRGCQFTKQDSESSVRDKLTRIHGNHLENRIKETKNWYEMNITRHELGTAFSVTLERECDNYIDGMVSSKKLCEDQCSYGCFYNCLLPDNHYVEDGSNSKSTAECLPKGAAERKHDCLRCQVNPDTKKHQCEYSCSYCVFLSGTNGKELKGCCKPSGHRCQNPTDVWHLCNTEDSLKRGDSDHRCKHDCVYYDKARGCLEKRCRELINGHGLPRHTNHLCSPSTPHLCNKNCKFFETCRNKCSEKYSHGTPDHLCEESHRCAEECTAGGICDLSLDSPPVGCSRVYPTKNGLRKKCKIPIPRKHLKHTQTEHSCVGKDEQDQHTCAKYCRWCKRLCTKKFHHQSRDPVCYMKDHGEVDNDEDTIEVIQQGEVEVKLVKVIARAVSASSASPEKIATCELICYHAGPRHVHRFTDQLGKPKRVKHSSFWKDETRFKDPSRGSPEDLKQFDGCPNRCLEDHKGIDSNSDDLFCREDACHTPLRKDCVLTGEASGHCVSTSVGKNVKGKERIPGCRFMCTGKHTSTCQAKCLVPHTTWFLTKLVTGQYFTGPICMKDIYHDGRCLCGKSDVHVCGDPCAGSSCKNKCEVKLDIQMKRTDHKPCSCGKTDCLAKCELIVCKSTGSAVSAARHHASDCRKGCRPCDKPCEHISNHFHKPGYGEHHFCGKHMCGKLCDVGRCQKAGKNNPCARPLNARFEHADGSVHHQCKEPLAGHFCVARCGQKNANSQQCHDTCGKKVHDNSVDHDCGKHQCGKPCVRGRCSDYGSVQCNKVGFKDICSGPHHCVKSREEHLCNEECASCATGGAVISIEKSKIGGFCAKFYGHPDSTIHFCDNHSCEEDCQSQFRCTKDASPEQMKSCVVRLVEKDGQLGHQGEPHLCSPESEHYCNKKVSGCGHYCGLLSGHVTKKEDCKCTSTACSSGQGWSVRIRSGRQKKKSSSGTDVVPTKSQAAPVNSTGTSLQHVRETTPSLLSPQRQQPATSPNRSGPYSQNVPGTTAASAAAVAAAVPPPAAAAYVGDYPLQYQHSPGVSGPPVMPPESQAEAPAGSGGNHLQHVYGTTPSSQSRPRLQPAAPADSGGRPSQNVPETSAAATAVMLQPAVAANSGSYHSQHQTGASLPPPQAPEERKTTLPSNSASGTNNGKP